MFGICVEKGGTGKAWLAQRFTRPCLASSRFYRRFGWSAPILLRYQVAHPRRPSKLTFVNHSNFNANRRRDLSYGWGLVVMLPTGTWRLWQEIFARAVCKIGETL